MRKFSLFFVVLMAVLALFSTFVYASEYVSKKPIYCKIDDILGKYILACSSGNGNFNFFYSTQPFSVVNGKFVTNGTVMARYWDKNNHSTIPTSEVSQPRDFPFGPTTYPAEWFLETNQLSISKDVYPGSTFNYIVDWDKQPKCEVYIGENKLAESTPEERNINYIEGFDSIDFFWINQSTDRYNFTIDAIKTGFLGIESTVNIDKVTSYSPEYVYTLSKPNTEYIYKLQVEDASSPYLVTDGFTGYTRFYYFKFKSAVKPDVTITGAANNSTVSESPVITVTKINTTKQYDIYVNNNKIYTFSQSAKETYRINSDIFNLGQNTVAVYDGIYLVKGLDFIVKPSGGGSDGTGEVIPPNGEDGLPPIDEYEPPPVSDGKPELPEVDDPYSDWIYYYLQVIIYWVELPFKMLANLLKDLKTNVVDNISTFVNTYNSLFSSTKTMFGFLPASVWSVISFGFALSIFLWFFKARRS